MKDFELSRIYENGREFEDLMVGRVDINNPQHRKEWLILRDKCANKGKTNNYVGFDDGVELAKKFQPYDPTNPNKPFARDIRIELMDILQKNGLITFSDEDQDRIKFYTLVDTGVDKMSGIDSILEFKSLSGKIYPVNFDLTINPYKVSKDADVIVHTMAYPKNDQESSKEYIAQIKNIYGPKVFEFISMKMKLDEDKKNEAQQQKHVWN